MFTGLIQQIGEVSEVRRRPVKDRASSTRITVITSLASRLKTGDSIAVSGVCLTALAIAKKQFSADLARETLERTSLRHLQAGALVNLELPARAQDRLGGHVVQGHVDAVGELLSLERIPGAEDWRLSVEVPSEIARYIVPQGSIAIEGISLTVAAIEGRQLQIAIIPHTYRATNIHTLKAGDPVNIEVDVLAKYAEKIAQAKPVSQFSVSELIRKGF